MGLEFSTDGGWIAVDDAGNYDDELQQEINAAAAASGVDVRDPGMGYRPTLTDKGYSFAPTIADPTITIANLLSTSSQAAGTGRYASSDPSTQQLMADIQRAVALGEAQLEAPQEAQVQVTAPQDGDPNPNGDGTVWDTTVGAYVAADTVKEPSKEVQLSESEQYLKDIMEGLDTGVIPDNYQEVINQLATDYQNKRLTKEQVQEYIDKLGTTAIGKLTDTNVASVEQFLKEVHSLFSPLGPGSYNPWLRSLGYTPKAVSDAAAADVALDLGSAAATATDVDAFINNILSTAMDGGSTWGEALNAVATQLFNNKSIWATANDGVGFPGLSGKIGTLNSVEDVKQWLHGAYSDLDDTVRTTLENKYTDRGDLLSSDYTVFATAAAAVAADGSITVYDNQGTETKVFPEGDKSAEEVAADLGFTGIPPTDGVRIPQAAGQIPRSTVYDPYTALEERTFAQEYPGFARSQPGYRMPAIESAYARARVPLQTQYGLQIPNLLMPGGEGLDPTYQSSADWLRGLTAGGTGQILRGADLYGALQGVAGALTGDPNILGTDPSGDLWRKYFETPGQQAAAYAQPFLMATRGAPEARTALTEAIANAAARFEYENPAGVMGPSGQRQGFLPWALEQNLFGINQMFNPRTTRVPDPMNPLTPTPTASYWGSPEGMKRQEWDLDIQM